MKAYDVYENPRLGRREVVKKGFIWPAFFFGPFWAWSKVMVVIGSVMLGAGVGLAILLVMGLFWIIPDHFNLFIMSLPHDERKSVVESILLPYFLGWSIFLGFNASKWRGAHLKRKGYKLVKTVESKTLLTEYLKSQSTVMKTQSMIYSIALGVFAVLLIYVLIFVLWWASLVAAASSFADHNRTNEQEWMHAQGGNPFANVNAIRCDFLPGVTADWGTGKPVESKSKFDPIIFHSLNFETGTAIMKGNNYSPKVRLFWTDKGMTFVEWLDGDVVVITTVWAHTVGIKPLRLSAVHSRHRMLGTPLPSQFHGVCEVL